MQQLILLKAIKEATQKLIYTKISSKTMPNELKIQHVLKKYPKSWQEFDFCYLD